MSFTKNKYHRTNNCSSFSISMALPSLSIFMINLIFILNLIPSLTSTSSTSSSPRAIPLPLSTVRSRLETVRMPLYGDLALHGYYTAHVMIGTPPREYDLVVDTGSTVTFVPCSTCQHCGNNHKDPKFHPELSTTYEPMICDIDCTCDTDTVQCIYDRQYADMSNSSGVLGTDLISFNDQSGLAPQRVLFGCENVETGSLSSLSADGIMGLGRGDLSIVDQLVDRGVISDSFSLCYGGMDVGGGTMILGEVPPPKDMIFTHSNVVNSSFYYVELKEFHVAGKPLSLDPSVFDGQDGTVLDSGTTFAFFPEAAFIEFKQAMIKELHSLKQIPGPHPSRNYICFSGAGSEISELSKYFPILDMVFERGQKVSLFPENYLFRHPKVHGGYCLGILQNEKDSSTLLGGIIFRNTFVTYDRESEQIGFWKTNCSEIWERLNATGALPPGPPTLEILKPSPLLPPAAIPTRGSPYITLGKTNIGLITFYMYFNVTRSIIEPHIEELIGKMAEELDLHASQVQILSFKPEGNGSLLRWAISPAGSDDYIASTTARSIIYRLAEHHIHLPEIFGSYQFSGLKAESSLKRTWWQQHHTAVTLTIIVAVLLGLSVSAIWFIWKRKPQTFVPYKHFQPAVPEQELQLTTEQYI